MSILSFRTDEEILQALEHVKQSPSDGGILKAIVIRPKPNERIRLTFCRLSPEGGTDGDNWARGCWKTLPDGRPHPDVQICITNSRMIDLVAIENDRWELAGDNLFVDFDLSCESLVTGQRLHIGESIIEITDIPHNGCKKFSQRFGEAALRAVNSPLGKQLRLRGVYSKVIQAGEVRVGDVVKRA